MQKLIKKVVKKGEEEIFCFFCEPRIVDGKITKNPRYLQTVPICLTHAPFTWQRRGRLKRKLEDGKASYIGSGSPSAAETILRTRKPVFVALLLRSDTLPRATRALH